jgi:fumarate reductase flavoprotein subunit
VRSRNIGLRYKARGANPELVAGYRIQKMLKVALSIAYGALTRTESRGAHSRQDYPRRDDSQWLKRTLATWRNESDTLPALAYEPLDVRKMELPPGWRGYGAKDYIDHPDTAARAAEVEAIRKSAGLDRFALQAKLMPYEHLLPGRFRGRNERVDERFDEPAAKRAAS